MKKNVITTGLARWKSYKQLREKWEQDFTDVSAKLAQFATEHPEHSAAAEQFATLERNPEKSVVIRRLVNFLNRRHANNRMAMVERQLSASGEQVRGTGNQQFARNIVQFQTWAPDLVQFLGIHAEYENIRLSLAEAPTKTSPHPVNSRVEPVFAGPDNGSYWGYTNLCFPKAGERRGSVTVRGVVYRDGRFEDSTIEINFETGARLPHAIEHKDPKSQTVRLKSLDDSWVPAKFGGLRLMVSEFSTGLNAQLDPDFGVLKARFELSFLLKEEVQKEVLSASSLPALGEKLPSGSTVLSLALAGEKLFVGARAFKNEDGSFSPAHIQFSQHERFGVSVGQVVEANREFASVQKKTGQMSKGTVFAQRLADRRSDLLDTLIDTAVSHIVAMAAGVNHRQEKGPEGKPRKINRFSVATSAKVVILPKVEGIRTSLYREAGENSGIRILRLRWAVERLKQRLEAQGMKIWEVGDFGVHDLCSKCGNIGTRAQISNDEHGKSSFTIRRNGDYLVCACCKTGEKLGRVTSAAENAVRNQLALMTDPARFDRYRKFFGKADRPALRKEFVKFENQAREVLRARGMEEVLK